MRPKYISTFGKKIETSVPSASWDQMPDPYEGRAVYKLIGTFERVTQPAATLPFEVGKVYKDEKGRQWRVVADDFPNGPFCILAMRTTVPQVGYFDGKGTPCGSFNLIPDRSTATTRVEFVPFVEFVPDKENES